MQIKERLLTEGTKVIAEIKTRAKKVECVEDLEKIATVSVEDGKSA